MSSDHTPPREGWQDVSSTHLSALRELADDLDRIVQEVSTRDGDATARQRLRAEAVRAAAQALATLRQERDEARTENARLREALDRSVAYIEGAVRSGGVKAASMANAFERGHRDGLQHALNAIRHEVARAALTPPAAAPQESERCVFTMRTVPDVGVKMVRQWASSCGQTWTPVEAVFDPRRRSHCPSCDRPLTVAAPQNKETTND